jgi:TetR/AcrR family transcriptional repressor of nem operon
MDISKSSFYQTFGSKLDLFQRCLGNYRDSIADRLRTALDQSASGKAFIETILTRVADGLADPMGRCGCLLMNTAKEFAQRDPQVAALVAKSLDRIEDLFYAAVCRAQAEGNIPKDANARSLAFFILTNLGGLSAMTQAGANPEKIRTAVQIIMKGLK